MKEMRQTQAKDSYIHVIALGPKGHAEISYTGKLNKKPDTNKVQTSMAKNKLVIS
jgi:hypothetical protein